MTSRNRVIALQAIAVPLAQLGRFLYYFIGLLRPVSGDAGGQVMD
jgi:hypothetical protein